MEKAALRDVNAHAEGRFWRSERAKQGSQDGDYSMKRRVVTRP